MTPPPLNEAISTNPFVRFARGWAAWLTKIASVIPWSVVYASPATSLNFPNIAANSQASLPITVRGARVGDSVSVNTADVSGLIFSAAVTADDTVTVYAKNFTTGGINPAAQDFIVTVYQG